MTTRKKLNWNRLSLLLMIAPFLVLLFIFSYIPLFGWSYAFVDYKPGLGLLQSSFVGLKYFHIMLFEQGSELLRVLRNTFALSFLGLFLSPLPVVFAILLNELRSRSFKKFVQTITTLPNFVSWIIVYSIVVAFFSTDGVVNQLLLALNWISEPTQMLSNAEGTWLFQTALGVWKSLGWSSIIYLAAIAGIDTELYDAAKVDGAGRYRSILHITLPGLIPTFFVLLILNIASILSVGFDQYFVFYNPLVADRIETLDYYVYRIGIATNDVSFGTAISIAKSIVSITLLFSVNYLSKKVRGQSII
ncbi:ABC transporter permease [Paenibacillus sp. PL91]|uniref:ABC transporter permease n=1 Tax=Paenibacillus sp. PL91 TaxID=2729538 RepID=UPI00145DDB34|nr:ABC transporter permease subunit [Paenibacillus sp. PL91]MBC9204440.1 sugar ABC transporter permease [Paenibacillus sp. PL91]